MQASPSKPKQAPVRGGKPDGRKPSRAKCEPRDKKKCNPSTPNTVPSPVPMSLTTTAPVQCNAAQNIFLIYDLNGDGAENTDDLIVVFRSIQDPYGLPPCKWADINADGVIDLQDALNMMAHLIERKVSIEPLNLTYFDDYSFDWNQETLSGRRLSVPKDNEVGLFTAVPSFMNDARELQQQCGQPTSGAYAKGTGPRPTIKWDNYFVYDPNEKAGLSDYASNAKYWSGIFYYETRGLAPDGVRAYRHYRDATGTDLSVDYDKAIKEDSLIAQNVQDEIDAVKAAVKQLHDGKEGSFQFYSLKARLANSVTENWLKALGGHRIWSTGTVTYTTSPCQLKVDITIEMEDFYNFNNKQKDVHTGLPDNENGRFAVLGWAKPFYSRGKIKRTETISLQCCKDEDCGDPTQFDCQCSLCTTQCPTNQRSGGQGFTSFTVELFKTTGKITVSYDMYTIPDELNIYYEGTKIFTTGGLVSGARTLAVSYGSATSKTTFVTVEVNAPTVNTQWTVSVSCPP